MLRAASLGGGSCQSRQNATDGPPKAKTLTPGSFFLRVVLFRLARSEAVRHARCAPPPPPPPRALESASPFGCTRPPPQSPFAAVPFSPAPTDDSCASSFSYTRSPAVEPLQPPPAVTLPPPPTPMPDTAPSSLAPRTRSSQHTPPAQWTLCCLGCLYLQHVRYHERLRSWCAFPKGVHQQLAEASALAASVRAKTYFSLTGAVGSMHGISRKDEKWDVFHVSLHAEIAFSLHKTARFQEVVLIGHKDVLCNSLKCR